MKTMLKKFLKPKLIGTSLFIIVIAYLAVFYIKTARPDYYIVDYDFYLADDALYAFVIEGEGVAKHNDINNKDYLCGKSIMVFKKTIDSESPT